MAGEVGSTSSPVGRHRRVVGSPATVETAARRPGLDMFQVFYMDFAKVDRDVAYVAIVVHVCCKLLFPMFLFFQMHVASVFIWMLYIFYTYVASVLSGCYVCLQWFQVFLQVF